MYRGQQLKLQILGAIVILGAVLLASLGTAEASRAPSKTERQAIRVAAMRYCQHHQEDPTHPDLLCKWEGGIRISTANQHYAWADVAGPQIDGSGILKRVRGTRDWRMVRTYGGGILSCEYWYQVIPRPVVHDLGVEGFTEGDQTFKIHRC